MALLNFLENVVKGVASPVAGFASDVSNEIYNQGVAPALGLPHQVNPEQSLNPVAGKVAQYSGATGTLRNTLGNAAGTALLGVGGGELAGAEGGIGAKLASGAMTGAKIGGGVGVANDVANAPNVTPGNLTMSFLEGGAGGAALGAAGGAVGGIISDVKAARLAKMDNQTKIQKELTPDVGPVVARDVAPAVAQTNDPNIVKNVLIQDVNKKAPLPAETPPPQEGIAPQEEPNAFAPASGTEGAPSPAAVRVMDSLKSAQEQRDSLQETYTQQRGQKLGAATAAGADVPGLQGHFNELAQLKGELAKPGYTGLSNNLPIEDQNDLYAQLRSEVNDKVQGYQRIGTNEALRKIVYGDERPPQPGEIKLLRSAFGDDFGDKVQQSVDEAGQKDGLGDKAFGVWRAGLLTGTHILPKVALSHGVQSVGETLSSAIGSGIDKFISNFGFSTGERASTFTMKGMGQGFGQGLKKAGTLLKTGEDSGIGTNAQSDFQSSVKYGDSVPAKFLGAYVNGIGRLHGSIYKPFSEAKFVNSLYDQGLAQAKNQGLKGDAADNFVSDFVHQPPADAATMAEKDAREFSFQQSTQLGNIAQTIQSKGGPLGKALVPFAKIPSAIATDVFNYSPGGAMKTIYDGIKAAKTKEGWNIADQRAFTKGLGRSIVGTAAIIPGIMLYNRGMMTLGYPSDPKEQALWQDEGKTPNSVLVKGKWESLGSLGPVGSVLSIGGHMADSLLQGKDIGTAMVNGLAGGAQSIQEQSYLQGVNQASTALSDPNKASSVAKNYAGSAVPAGLANVAQGTDSLQRDTNGDNIPQSALNAIKNRIPGLREQLNPATDSFGNDLGNNKAGGKFNLGLADPGYGSTNATPGPLLSELRRLQNAGFGETPPAITKKYNFGTSKQPDTVQLSRDQQEGLKGMIGQLSQYYWSQAVQDQNYQQADDATRQAILKQIQNSATQEGALMFEQQEHIGRFSPNLQQEMQKSKQKRVNVI